MTKLLKNIFFPNFPRFCFPIPSPYWSDKYKNICPMNVNFFFACLCFKTSVISIFSRCHDTRWQCVPHLNRLGGLPGGEVHHDGPLEPSGDGQGPGVSHPQQLPRVRVPISLRQPGLHTRAQCFDKIMQEVDMFRYNFDRNSFCSKHAALPEYSFEQFFGTAW